MTKIVHFLGIIFLIHSLHAQAIEKERDCLMKFFEPVARQCPWEIYKSERENVLCKYRALWLVSADENRLNADSFIKYVEPHVFDLYDFESFKGRVHNCVKTGNVNHPRLSLVEQFDICIGGVGIKELSGALGCLPKQ